MTYGSHPVDMIAAKIPHFWEKAIADRLPAAFGFGFKAYAIWRNAGSASRCQAGSQAERRRACTVFLSEPIITPIFGFCPEYR